MLRKIDGCARGLAVGAGWVSLGMRLALTLVPCRSAAFLGWGGQEPLTRVIGVSDLVVGMGLLLGRSRSRWMMARAMLNAVIALVYARALTTRTPERRRVTGGMGLMIGLTFVDFSLSQIFRGPECRASVGYR